MFRENLNSVVGDSSKVSTKALKDFLPWADKAHLLDLVVLVDSYQELYTCMLLAPFKTIFWSFLPYDLHSSNPFSLAEYSESPVLIWVSEEILSAVDYKVTLLPSFCVKWNLWFWHVKNWLVVGPSLWLEHLISFSFLQCCCFF